MVEEQGLDANLENIHESVETLNVRQFVRNYGPKLIFGQALSAQWREETRLGETSQSPPEPATTCTRNIEWCGNAKLILQHVADLEYALAYYRGALAPLAFQQREASRGTQAKNGHSQKPCLDQPSKRVRGRESQVLARNSGRLCAGQRVATLRKRAGRNF